MVSLIPFHGRRGLRIVRGEGQYVWDSGGRRYLDVHTGHGVAFLGHRPPRVLEALREQMDSIAVLTPSFASEPMERCLSALGRVLPGGLSRVYLQNSGTEAVELALKLAFKATERRGVVAFTGSFHGRTLGSLSVTWNPRYRAGYPLLEAAFGRFNDPSSADLVGEDTAAVIVEPVQGEGGIRPSTPEFLRELRRACDEHGSVLIFDEVQSGFGRTGRVWAHQSRGVEPDVLVAGKSVGGGFPVSLVAARDWVAGQIRGGEHGSTHGGNPLACAAVYGGVRTLLEEDVPSKAAMRGGELKRGLEEVESRLVREVRGEGLMLGVELRVRPEPVIRELQERGLLALRAGATVLRLLPPYLITEEDVSTILEVVSGALRARGG